MSSLTLGKTTIWLPLAWKCRNGSVPRKLNRPTFSPPMTLSNRKDGAVRAIRRKAETGVSPDYVRLSIGLEHVDDIKADIDRALKASQK